MKLTDPNTKHKIISRLKRIEGQLRGVEAMIEQERDCQEIMQQFTAIRSAVQSASLIFLQEYAVNCMMQMDDKDQPDRVKLVSDLVNLLGKAP
ncbi:MAG: metal-sensitive transcriptional regulator [Anaerolineae bacterium]|nr:metal-sensitive transcriptional regulator [Anaerolineae bacterium]